MKIDEILNEWEKDSVIEETHLTEASLITAKLHHKYYSIYIGEKLLLHRMKSEHKTLLLLKTRYYRGELDRDELLELNWEQWQGKTLKADTAPFIEGDKDVVEATLKLALQQEKVDALDSILKMIMNRSYYIGNAISHLKYKAAID